jgi:DNA-binding LacI/PurR family transcriptional regulator
MKTTIYDVAKKAGVSIATVSKVINNTGNMRPATRRRVTDVMEEMNYYPSVMASALTGKRTQTLGLLVPDISNPFFSEMARMIEDRAHEKGMSVIMCSTDEDPEKEKKYLQLLQRKQVDGFIVASSFHDKSLLHGLMKNKVPFVMLTQDDASLDVSKVSVDDYKGGYEATSYLMENGHRNIAIFAEHAHSSKIRIYGCREAFEMHGIECREENIFQMTGTISSGRKFFREIFSRKEAEFPTAIFACNDLIAIGIIQEAKEQGIRIPEDLSLIGFDNTILASTTVPGLTTVAQPIEAMGKRIVDVLIDEIKEGASMKERVLFNPELIIRGTTTRLNSSKAKTEN